MEDIIGMLAATLTTVSFIPQALRVLKTKHTKDLSLSMYVIFTLGVSCWLAYGIMLVNIPIILANTITLVLAMVILYTKIKYG